MFTSPKDAGFDQEISLEPYPFELFLWEAGLVIAIPLAIALLVNLFLLGFQNDFCPALACS
jgi:hypothetical protein